MPTWKIHLLDGLAILAKAIMAGVGIAAILFASVVAVLFALSLFGVPMAEAAVDDFGRPWFGTVALSACPAAGQYSGVQFAQIRGGLPGVWIDARAGSDRQSWFGGLVVPLADCLAVRAGAGVDRLDGRLSVEGAAGVTVTWRRLAGHVGFDSGTRAASVGAGVTFWR